MLSSILILKSDSTCGVGYGSLRPAHVKTISKLKMWDLTQKAYDFKLDIIF
ncbi:hypothetical protein [Leptospira noguchii]|uniref:hypothetical protein n=1 Tax=Leptospira noguchii TaxID=28182 RepID=UPI00030461D0|nr:hypothetical protein [Leptospira noguchii]UOG61496.1 hypothetical protein MAL07_05615 [Leptospira noguchii]